MQTWNNLTKNIVYRCHVPSVCCQFLEDKSPPAVSKHADLPDEQAHGSILRNNMDIDYINNWHVCILGLRTINQLNSIKYKHIHSNYF